MLRLQRLALILTVVTILLGGAFRPSTAGRPAKAAVGYPAPDFTLNDLQGRSVMLSDLRDRPVLLNFWATWCPPCQAEMPELKRLKAEHPEVVILGVVQSEPPEHVAAYMKAGGYDWPVVIDDGSVSNTYEAFSLPTSFFIASNGLIRASYRGPMSIGLMEEMLAGAEGGQVPGGVAWPSWLTGRLVPPVLPLGPLALPTAPLLALLGAMGADWVVRRGAAPRVEMTERLLSWLLGGALAGAMLGEILRSPSSFLASPRLLIAVPAGKWALAGALLGAGLGLVWAIRRVEPVERRSLLDQLGLPLLVGLAIAGLGSGEAALLRAGGWLLGAGLLWPKRESSGAWLFALSWSATVWIVADLARPLVIAKVISTEQALGVLVVGVCSWLARAQAGRPRQ